MSVDWFAVGFRVYFFLWLFQRLVVCSCVFFSRHLNLLNFIFLVSHDQTLQKEHKFRSYEELKEELKDMNADLKTDAEVVTELVEKFRSVSHTQEDVTAILEQLEYYLHQVKTDNQCSNIFVEIYTAEVIIMKTRLF